MSRACTVSEHLDAVYSATRCSGCQQEKDAVMTARDESEIREDLRRAASTATGFCHDAAMRLAGDFESLLARIAAVEALMPSAELLQRCHRGRITHVGNKTHGGAAEYREMCPVCNVPSPCRTERLLTDLFTALAASPTPTGPEPATCEHGLPASTCLTPTEPTEETP